MRARGEYKRFKKPRKIKGKTVRGYYDSSAVDLIGYRLSKREMFYVLRAMTTYKDIEHRKYK